MRGNHLGELGLRPSAKGLSPRVRGTLRAYTLDNLQWGLSPRVRGNPAYPTRAPADGRSIPRVCGGTFRCDPKIPYSAYTGLSPRVRGNRTRSKCPLTPSPSGLSPRVRGNLSCRIGLTLYRRSIPACAGEPTASISSRLILTVYPRVCGGTHSGLRPRLSFQ